VLHNSPHGFLATQLPPNRGRGLRPLPQFEVPPDPTPEWIVNGTAYPVTHGADSLGERRISPPRPPLLFSVILEKGKRPLLQTFTPLSQRIARISSKRWETYSHPKSQLLRSEFREEFCKMSFEGGSGETCFQRFPPRPNPIMHNRTWGWKGDFASSYFHPPDCGGANSDNRHDGNNAPPLASERSERAGGGGQKFPRNGGRRGE